MRVLVTNDDGVRAPGLSVLARATRDLGYDVVVAAPAEEASGTGAAMSAYTSDGKVVVEKTAIDGITAYGVGASPGYIVLLSMLGAFGDRPDLVLSGINRGANSGRAIIHSGTVGAALTAVAQGRPALAVSLDAPFLDDDSDLALLLDGYATVTAIRGVTEQPAALRQRTPPEA